MAEAARDQQFVAQAPVVIAACGTLDLVMTCGQPSYTIDVAIAVDHMTLAAASLHLGTCWIGAFHEELVTTCKAPVPAHLRRDVATCPGSCRGDAPASPDSTRLESTGRDR
ncbi:MAG: nitroreductase family protein [Methanothrix sp.]|nr:nitroreductase family protein [Methanothrix sp.]